MTDNTKKIAITGIGTLASPGIGNKSLWDGLISKNIGLQLEDFTVENETCNKFYIHKIAGFNIKDFGINQNILDDIKNWKEGEEIIDLFFLLAATKLAITDSKIQYDTDNNKLGLIVTHENFGLEPYFSKIIETTSQILKKPNLKNIKLREIHEIFLSKMMRSSYELQTFMPLFHIAKTFGMHGYSLFINNACASGLYGLETARQIIKSGQCPAMVVVAADYPRFYKYSWFEQLKMCASDGITKPFSKDAHGFTLGDGGAALLLEDYDHAKSRNAHIYAEYAGGGFTLESWKVTVPAVGKSFLHNSIKAALKESNTDIREVDLICPHGVANPVNDYYESKAITDIFGNYPKQEITTFKPYIGHTLGASALLETAILLLCMENDLVLPTLNTTEISPNIKIELTKQKTKLTINTALKTCCAFAGFTAAAIFRKIH